MLQVWLIELSPEQGDPPFSGGVHDLRLVLVPDPQVTEHASQACQPVQTPFT